MIFTTKLTKKVINNFVCIIANHNFYVIIFILHRFTFATAFWPHKVKFHCQMIIPFTRYCKFVYHTTQIWSQLFKTVFDWCIFITFIFIFNIFFIKRIINFFWFIMVYNFFSISLTRFYKLLLSYRFWTFILDILL